MNTTLIMVEPDMRSHLAGVGLTSGEDFLTTRIGLTISQSASSTTRRFHLDAPAPGSAYFLKVYPLTSRTFRRPLRRDKASVEAANIQTLRRIGVGVPEVVCHGYQVGLFGRRASFILTRDVGSARPLDEYVDAMWPGGPGARSTSRRRSLIVETAQLVRKMHDAVFFHIDLQWRNILVAEEGAGWRLSVIDSPRGGTRTWGVFREHGRLRDLSSFAKQAAGRATRAEQIRWLHAYLGTAKLMGPDRELARVIARDRASKDNSHRA